MLGAGGAAARFAGRICLSLSSIRCKLMLLFPGRLGNRLDVELRDEEWDHWGGHGTASSLMASAVARVLFGKQGPQLTWECWEREIWGLCWEESGHCHLPIPCVSFHPCVRAFWEAAGF